MHSFNQLIKELSEILKEKNWQLVTAESCTGGLLASILTEEPGSSAWFERGFVTYSNLAKEELLAVPGTLLNQHGAVSEPIAAAMATGALKNSAGHIALSVTGIAGPDGGSIDKPVGTVCLGWAVRGFGEVKTLRKQFSGTRKNIRLCSCQDALVGTITLLKNIP